MIPSKFHRTEVPCSAKVGRFLMVSFLGMVVLSWADASYAVSRDADPLPSGRLNREESSRCLREYRTGLGAEKKALMDLGERLVPEGRTYISQLLSDLDEAVYDPDDFNAAQRAGYAGEKMQQRVQAVIQSDSEKIKLLGKKLEHLEDAGFGESKEHKMLETLVGQGKVVTEGYGIAWRAAAVLKDYSHCILSGH